MEPKLLIEKITQTLLLIIISGTPILKANLANAQNCREVIGYYPNWQWYDRNKLVNPQSIDYSKYTIINYSFFAPQADGTIDATDDWADENLLLGEINWASGGYYPNTSIVELAHNNGVKIIPAIGGWTLSDNFPIIAADPQKRATFAQSCVDLIQTYNFDGIDIDWEYPGFATHGGTAQDITNFNLLLQDIRTAIDNYGNSIGKTMILSACVSADPNKMDDIDWNTIAQQVDYINLMSYDFFGAFDPITNHNSPLKAPAQGNPAFNLDAAVQTLLNTYQVDPAKLNAGIAFYGRSQTTVSSPGLHVQGTGQADLNTFGTDQGTPLYYNVMSSLSQFDYHWDSLAKTPYLTGKNGLNTFVSFDDERSVALKAEYIVEQDLAGAIIWEITGDYMETTPGSGIIAGTPLADTINNVFCNYIPNSPDTTGNGGNGNPGLRIDEVIKPLVSVYPNPANSSVSINFNRKVSAVLKLRSSEGRLIKQSEIYADHYTLEDIAELAAGMYFLEVDYLLINQTEVLKIIRK
ncbi:glycosyl hydrolase family 18 protein [Parvicella tangerina]|uniref:chitinase n=1 Tax=Parvicella tangerina TaxID=2829795 RepID=A0A916NFA3_9FLAO|nr:glycosyl hydrolase family 18 protein [Parvicella tangerina]CAG5077339.1 hypothetical protein CRYO30217_00355 [Parvicella tangerina]